MGVGEQGIAECGVGGDALGDDRFDLWSGGKSQEGLLVRG